MSPAREPARIAGLMSLLPFSALWAALAIAAVLSLALPARSRLSPLLPIVLLLVAGALWLWGRPLTADPPLTATLLGANWRIGPAAWGLTGIVLAVLLTVGLSTLPSARSGQTKAALAGAFLLSLALLPFIWAGDPRSSLLLLALFALGWTGVLAWTGAAGIEGRQVGVVLAPLLLLWFADAVALAGAASPLWRELAGAAIVVAGAGLLGVWPFGGWRHLALSSGLPAAISLIALPVVAGAVVLLPVAQQTAMGGAQLAVAVVLGLLSVLLGLRSAGDLIEQHPAGLAGLAGTLAGLVLLAAVFTPESTLPAATRVAVFVPLALLLAGGVATNRLVAVLRAGVVVVAWLAVVGVPLTAGFTTVSALYAAWQPGTQLLLVALMALLLLGWSAVLSTVALRLLRRLRDEGATAPDDWRAIVPALVPVASLLTVDPAPLAEMSAISWVALVVPVVGGPVLAWLLDGRLDLSAATATSPASLVPAGVMAPLTGAWRSGRRLAGDAVTEALTILEGPGGLLWVLGIILLLLLIR